MFYKANDYSLLLGIKGFSRTLLENHFALYEGYIKNSNKLLETLAQLLEEGNTATLQFSEIERRLAFELNGIHLHEMYFENMSKAVNGEPSKETYFYKKVVSQFGSFAAWKKSFRAVASMRGVGWAITIYDPRAEILINTWVDEHHLGHVAGAVPVLILDLWEHALLLDYGSDREKYIDAFFNILDWTVVSLRFAKATEFQESYAVWRKAEP